MRERVFKAGETCVRYKNCDSRRRYTQMGLITALDMICAHTLVIDMAYKRSHDFP